MKNTLLLGALIFSFQNYAIADEDPPDVAIGERLFLETRFSQAYYANPHKADPVMDKTVMVNASLKGPFRGKTMNCRACHMVDEHENTPSAGMRSYTDYASRSPVPNRTDDVKTSGRNSMSMVNISLSHQTLTSATFHFDGEFNSMEDIVRATYTGRNFGWLVGEDTLAIQHIAKIIREDSGKSALAKEFGGSYAKIFKSSDTTLAKKFRLPKEYRLDVYTASDKQIFDTIAKFVSAYVSNLRFQQDQQGRYNGSPYDAFLTLNNLPRKPNKNESNKAYSKRLMIAVNQLRQPRFVKPSNRAFVTHQQKFTFSNEELKGLKLFFNKGNQKISGGNCVSCHTAPHFSDFGFHNTGLSQQNYDELHGNGAFIKLFIPTLAARNKDHNAFLPATSKHPLANSRFRSIATKNKIGYTDLGLWNVFANPDMPKPQKKLITIMCTQNTLFIKKKCNDAAILQTTLAAFKTPVLRNLGHSSPYMHTGQFNTIQQTIEFYVTSSTLAKNNKIRNTDRAMKSMNLSTKNVAPLVAFLKSLNEDYD